jgi:hypothetical protein
VSEAAAQHAAEGFRDFLVRRPRFFVEDSFGTQDYATQAKAALGSAFLDENLLQRVRLFRRAETIERRNFILAHCAYRHHTGADCLAAQNNRAGPALRHSAPEFRTPQLKLVA